MPRVVEVSVFGTARTAGRILRKPAAAVPSSAKVVPRGKTHGSVLGGTRFTRCDHGAVGGSPKASHSGGSGSDCGRQAGSLHPLDIRARRTEVHVPVRSAEPGACAGSE